MKKLLLMLAAFFLMAGVGFADMGIQAAAISTINADATFDPITVPAGTTGQFFIVEARTDVEWRLAASADPGSNYKTIKAGDSYTFGFNRELQGEYIIGYGQSTSGDVVIETLPFNPK